MNRINQLSTRPVLDTAIQPTSDTHVTMRDGASLRLVAVVDLVEQLGASALVRLHFTDFDNLSKLGRTFMHFNLGSTLHEVGRRYAIVPIVRPGRRSSDGREVLPVVDPSRFRLADCLEVVQGVPLNDLAQEAFLHSLPTIRTVAELRHILVARYHALFPSLSPDEIIAQGCTVTRFDLIGVRP